MVPSPEPGFLRGRFNSNSSIRRCRLDMSVQRSSRMSSGVGKFLVSFVELERRRFRQMGYGRDETRLPHG